MKFKEKIASHICEIIRYTFEKSRIVLRFLDALAVFGRLKDGEHVAAH